MYAVCKQRFIPTGQTFTTIDRHSGRAVTAEWMRADFSQHEETLVRDMDEAKRIYGGAPILQAVKK